MTHGIRHGVRIGSLLLVAQLLLYVWLQLRPGASAVIPYLVGPKLLAIAAGVTFCAALWRSARKTSRTLLLVFEASACILTVTISMTAYREYPSSHDGRPASTCFQLPLDGEIVVQHGGKALAENYHAAFPPQRYAYDMSVLRNGRTYQREGYMAWDYHVYGQPVRSPSAGRVVRIADGDPDQNPSAEEPLGFKNAGGNHVVVEVNPGLFMFVGHFQPGTIRVRQGDRVATGDILALAGNSGRSSAPHVHLHLQDSPEGNRGEGVPLEFCEYEVRSLHETQYRHIGRGAPSGGVNKQVIRSSARSRSTP